MSFKSINPFNGEVIQIHPEMTDEKMEQIMVACARAFDSWRLLDFAERGKVFKNIAGILRKNSTKYAELMAVEMGKPVSAGLKEIEKCAWVCEFFSENTEKYLAPQLIQTEAKKSYVRHEPLGIILAIMPWNFPFWQVFRFATPALMAGNTVLLKHAPNTTGCSLVLEEIFAKAGYGDLLRALVVDTDKISRVIHDPRVAAVTLTGSTRAGRAVAAEAGRALKKCVLELGGSDPYIVLADADLDDAARICADSRMNNAGQVCISAKRLIVEKPVYEEFLKKLAVKMNSYIMGDPFKNETTLGPLAREDLRESLHIQVQKSIRQGAELVCGGKIPSMKGFFYPPTILTKVTKGMPAFDEELFGPVAAVICVKDEEEALKVANDTDYGLGAAVFSRDVSRAERIVKKIQAGSCAINFMVKSDPRLPFGGIKNSGFGRELGTFGIHEFTNIKSVYIK